MNKLDFQKVLYGWLQNLLKSVVFYRTCLYGKQSRNAWAPKEQIKAMVASLNSLMKAIACWMDW